MEGALVDLLPERNARPSRWWSFAPTNVLFGVGLPFLLVAVAWAADLLRSFTWMQLLAVLVLSAIGLYYLAAAALSAESAHNRRRRAAHAPRRVEPPPMVDLRVPVDA